MANASAGNPWSHTSLTPVKKAHLGLRHAQACYPFGKRRVLRRGQMRVEGGAVVVHLVQDDVLRVPSIVSTLNWR